MGRSLGRGETAPLSRRLRRRDRLRDDVRAARPAAGARASSPGYRAQPHVGAASAIILDPTMQRLYALLDVIAPSPLNVIVLGETGTGKEVFAEAIHNGSRRAHAPLLRINCAALSGSLLESELFGHEKGAFTGALGAKAGLFESADGGTVFLDEVGELPLDDAGEAAPRHRVQSRLVRRTE